MRNPYWPVSTYSITALDRESGQLGVAVQSHWFSVGPIVPWVEAGVGAVATQSLAEVSYGPFGLALMRGGKTAQQALDSLLASDEGADTRQVGMVDAAGNVAAHTGERCIPEAGHLTGDGYSVQANLMLNDTVPQAMQMAFENTSGDLLERFMVTLEAAEAAGGDVRGKQSVAILIAPGPDDTTAGYGVKLVDLRIEDHPQPLEEMRRIVTVHRAYEWSEKGAEAVEKGDMQAARGFYAQLKETNAGDLEPEYWYAIALASNDHVDEALPIFERVFASDKMWADLIDRLAAKGHFPDDETLIKRVKSVAP